MALLPLDFFPIEMQGMSVVTAIIITALVLFGAYIVRNFDKRMSTAEEMMTSHHVSVATVKQSNASIAKSLDIARETMREDLKNAVDRIEDRFAQIQSMIQNK